VRSIPFISGGKPISLPIRDGESFDKLRKHLPLNQKRAPQPNRREQLQEQLGRPGLDLKETLKAVPAIV
jgi:hypothetical protein